MLHKYQYSIYDVLRGGFKHAFDSIAQKKIVHRRGPIDYELTVNAIEFYTTHNEIMRDTGALVENCPEKDIAQVMKEAFFELGEKQAGAVSDQREYVVLRWCQPLENRWKTSDLLTEWKTASHQKTIQLEERRYRRQEKMRWWTGIKYKAKKQPGKFVALGLMLLTFLMVVMSILQNWGAVHSWVLTIITLSTALWGGLEIIGQKPPPGSSITERLRSRFRDF